MLAVILLVVTLCRLPVCAHLYQDILPPYSPLKMEEVFFFEALVHMRLQSFVTDTNTTWVLTVVKKNPLILYTD